MNPAQVCIQKLSRKFRKSLKITGLMLFTSLEEVCLVLKRQVNCQFQKHYLACVLNINVRIQTT